MVTWMEIRNGAVESKEYLGDSFYSSLFPFSWRLKKKEKILLKLNFFLLFNAECRNDDGGQGVVIDDEEGEF